MSPPKNGQIFSFRLCSLVCRLHHCWHLAESLSLSALRKPLLLEGSVERGIGAAKKMAQLSLLWPFAGCKPRLGVTALLLLACSLGQTCFAQGITVRVINGRNGHPLSKQTVVAQFLDEQPAKVSTPQEITTDRNGDAQIAVPKPAPKHLNVRLVLTSGHWNCSCGLMTDTGKVLGDGVLQGATAHGVQVRAKPGQVVFVVTPFTFFERILYPLLKQ